MNASIIHKANVKEQLLDQLASQLPAIIAAEMEVPGGHVALLKPEQVSLVFSGASPRDTGSDIKIIVYARSNDPRTSTEKDRAQEMLEKVVALIDRSGHQHSVDIRLYLMEIGAAEYTVKP